MSVFRLIGYGVFNGKSIESDPIDSIGEIYIYFHGSCILVFWLGSMSINKGGIDECVMHRNG